MISPNKRIIISKTIIKLLLFFAVPAFASLPLVEQNLSWSEVVDYAKENLPLEGQLQVKSDGFVYLKVDDAYIYTLFPLLGLHGYKEPPYFRSEDSPGAHVTVFYETEHVHPKEIGQTFHFELGHIKIVRTRSGKFAVLQIHSPELEKLRVKYGLSPKIYGHDYHITLAKKKR